MGAKLAEREVTAVLSNMSVVKMPPEYAKYIERFGVIQAPCVQSFVYALLEIRCHLHLLPDTTARIFSVIFIVY